MASPSALRTFRAFHRVEGHIKQAVLVFCVIPVAVRQKLIKQKGEGQFGFSQKRAILG